MTVPSKRGSILLLILSSIAVLSLWFSSAAVLGEMADEAGLETARLAWLTTAVQIGFAGGAVLYAVFGVSDIFDPRRVFCVSALAGAAANLGLLAVPVGGWEAVCLRALTGAAIAGVYPVGMKIAVGWGREDRALLVGALVGALTLGSASPHLLALLGGADWRPTIWATSGLAAAGAGLILLTSLGPFHAQAPKLDIRAIGLAWSNRAIRLAILGYLGHMWELYAFWAWVGVIASGSLALSGAEDPSTGGKVIAFVAIAIGGLACIPAGRLGDRRGHARVALACLLVSGSAAVLSALAYGGPGWLIALALVVWGLAIIPDSALYSTLVAHAAPPERAGSLLTIQNALGFLLTAATVQIMPLLAGVIGWPGVMALLAIGPAFGALAMLRTMRPEPARAAE